MSGFRCRELAATEAVTLAGPVTVPAVTVIEARPFASVVAVVAESEIEPVPANCTGMLAAAPALAVTWTTSGCANAVLTAAD